jgi:hypothetical protein
MIYIVVFIAVEILEKQNFLCNLRSRICRDERLSSCVMKTVPPSVEMMVFWLGRKICGMRV